MFGLWRTWKRSRWAKQPIPEHWHDLLREKVPFYSTLPPQKREDFLSKLNIFIQEKYFIGAQGMKITDEVRVMIAAAAVRLILYLDMSYYNKLTEIVVYPYDYLHPNEEGIFYGEAHTWGVVVLSWPAVEHGIRETADWGDTTTHEFAHALDVANGEFNGTPRLRHRKDYEAWSQTMSQTFLDLREGDLNNLILLGDYAAKNEAEFFAVSTEAFFGQPKALQRHAPSLYRELRRFYGWDPPSPQPPTPAELVLPVWMPQSATYWA